MATFDSCEPRAPDTRGWSSKTGLVFVALLHRVRPKAGSTKTAPLRRRTHSRHPFHRSAGKSRTLSTSRTRPCWPRSRGVTHAPFGKMLRHPISKRQKPVGTHRTSSKSPSVFDREPCGPSSHTFGWTARWTPLRSSLPSPPFMVSTKDMTREARLERSPALRFAPS
jgi:hypothetical protein